MKYDLTNKNIMITGANAGIGKAATIQLAQAGAKVIMACRSAERGQRALEEVRSITQNNRIELSLVDMSSQASIREFAKVFKQQHETLDGLIHNAANFDLTMKQPIKTVDGIETIFATNHIGPFLLTYLLLDLLKASVPSRIITVASKGLMTYPFLDIEFDNLNGERKYSPQHAYYHAKQAQVMFALDLAERLKGTGVTVNCVRVSNVAVPDERLTHLSTWALKIYRIKRKLAMTPEKMAETYTWLAADPSVQNITGGYWDAPNVSVKANKNAYKRATQRRLWEVSQQLSGIENWDPGHIS
jgi:NAD(P)-dependent dehydrogenase (short-subunit alcohol dehydrogenase family)